MTTTMPTTGKLLVDYEDGRVLRADAEVEVTPRFIESHPFITHRAIRGEVVIFVGPDAGRRMQARTHGHGEARLDAVEYELHQNGSSNWLLRKKEDA
jgi:hypothetical protein